MVSWQLTAQPLGSKLATTLRKHAKSRFALSTKAALWSIDTTLDAPILPLVDQNMLATSTILRIISTTNAKPPQWHLDFSNSQSVPSVPNWEIRMKQIQFYLARTIPTSVSVQVKIHWLLTSLLILMMQTMVSPKTSTIAMTSTLYENLVLLCNFVINLFQTKVFCLLFWRGPR